MNYKLLIINSLLLLFWEGQLDVGTGGSHELIKNTLNNFKIPNDCTDSEKTQEFYITLHSYTMKQVLRNVKTLEREQLTRDIKILGSEEPEALEAILDSVERLLDQSQIRETCIQLTSELKEYTRAQAFVAGFRKKFNNLLFNPTALFDTEFNLNRLTQAIVEMTEPYTIREEESVHNLAGVMDFVDFGNIEELKKVFELTKNQVSPEEIIKYPWKALNRMCGVQGGGRRGEMVLVGGLQHHGKSTVSLAMTMSATLFNKPHCRDPEKMPAVVMMATENDMSINMKAMYQMLVEPVIKRKINIADIDPVEAAELVQAKFAENGIRFFAIRVNPDECGYPELQNILLTIESKGYEILCFCIDYLGMLSTKGIYEGGITGRDKQAMFKRTRNLMVAHHILCITPHQLSTEALQIERDEPNRLMDRVLNRAYYHDCKTIAQEVDMEIIIQKIKVDGQWWLYFGRGKHRGVNDTPEEDMRFALPFTAFGLLFDVDTDTDTSSPRPGANSSQSGGQSAWHQMATTFEMEA